MIGEGISRKGENWLKMGYFLNLLVKLAFFAFFLLTDKASSIILLSVNPK